MMFFSDSTHIVCVWWSNRSHKNTHRRTTSDLCCRVTFLFPPTTSTLLRSPPAPCVLIYECKDMILRDTSCIIHDQVQTHTHASDRMGLPRSLCGWSAGWAPLARLGVRPTRVCQSGQRAHLHSTPSSSAFRKILRRVCFNNVKWSELQKYF